MVYLNIIFSIILIIWGTDIITPPIILMMMFINSIVIITIKNELLYEVRKINRN